MPSVAVVGIALGAAVGIIVLAVIVVFRRSGQTLRVNPKVPLALSCFGAAAGTEFQDAWLTYTTAAAGFGSTLSTPPPLAAVIAAGALKPSFDPLMKAYGNP